MVIVTMTIMLIAMLLWLHTLLVWQFFSNSMHVIAMATVTMVIVAMAIHILLLHYYVNRI